MKANLRVQINANMLNHICIKEQLSTMKFNEVTGE